MYMNINFAGQMGPVRQELHHHSTDSQRDRKYYTIIFNSEIS